MCVCIHPGVHACKHTCHIPHAHGKQVRLYGWWQLLVSNWLIAALDVQQQLTQIFLTHDDNGDGDVSMCLHLCLCLCLCLCQSLCLSVSEWP